MDFGGKLEGKFHTENMRDFHLKFPFRKASQLSLKQKVETSSRYTLWKINCYT